MVHPHPWPSVIQPIERILHAELFSIDQLNTHGEALARTHILDRRPGKDQLLFRLDANEQTLMQTHRILAACGRADVHLSPAGTWLLDNFYLIQEQMEIARKHLPKRYSQKLPRLLSGPCAKLPRIFSIAQELISHVDGRIDEVNLKAVLSAYQRVHSLTLGELWAIPIMLRLALIENIRYVGERVEASFQDRQQATLWADRMLRTVEENAKNIILDLADLSKAEIPLSTTFVTELIRRLQGQSPALNLPVAWIEQRLAEQGRSIERQIQMESQLQAINQISISNSIGALRFLSACNWSDFVESMSRVEQILRLDPAGLYAKMDFHTRDRYRHAIERVARQSAHSEEAVATQAIELSITGASRRSKESHVGFYLVDRGQQALERSLHMRWTLRDGIDILAGHIPLAAYLTPIALLTLACAGFALYGLPPVSTPVTIAFGMLLLLLFSQLALSLVNWVATRIIAPKQLPRMDFSDGIPAEFSTLVTVPTLLSSSAGIDALLSKIEISYLSDRTKHLYFSLLTDFKDADLSQLPEDASLLAQVRAGIQKLNVKHAQDGVEPFLLFHRPRTWNATEKKWMGYERKRGKLEELNEALRSKDVSKILHIGNAALLPSIRYVITLDTDTLLPREVARGLVETMAHPLNAPIYNEGKQRVCEGYTILQPRVTSSLSNSTQTWYARIFGSNSGIDPYTRAISDVYQDIFGEGSFIGKGIYDVDMFAKALGNRLPENRILSHDLLEGTYGRSGFVSDLQLVDEYPEKYGDDVARNLRWIRGDWQITAWLFAKVPGFRNPACANPISLLSRWKLFDNLRRSLVPPAMFALIIMSMLYNIPLWFGLAVCGAILWLPTLPEQTLAFFNKPKRYPLFLHLKSWMQQAFLQAFQGFFRILVLPYEAFVHLTAIVCTVWRMGVSHRNLLEWTASGEAQPRHAGSWLASQKRMGSALVVAVLIPLAFHLTGKDLTWGLITVLVLWACGPSVAWRLSTPTQERTPLLTPKQQYFLRKVSRKTWRYFETFVTAKDNWLPPDNYQEAPAEATAHRTSPTNIGIMLLSNLGAYDLGYLSTAQLVERCHKSLKTMAAMAKFRGHFFNWYETRTLEPLSPHYVSTVDSGNLMGFLLTLAQGLATIPQQPISPKSLYRGLLDTLLALSDNTSQSERLGMLIQSLAAQPSPTNLAETDRHLADFAQQCQELRAIDKHLDNLEQDHWYAAFASACQAQRDDLSYLAPWLSVLDQYPDLSSEIHARLIVNRTLASVPNLLDLLPEIPSPELAYCIRQGVHRAKERIAQLEDQVRDCQNMADQNLDFLYDKTRHLLTIGFDVGKHRRDDSYYDILASEARLASFIGIAQGKLPVKHWFSMGRHVTVYRGKMVLLSWGGSMFEYLMPRLLLPSYANTLLDQTLQGAVEKQIAYGKERGVPWGISESGMHITDAYLNYQYRSFGVPGLGFKNDLAHDLVIAPYASLLALMVRPTEACVNLELMSRLGYEGRFGFYEAIDHTPARLALRQSEGIVRSFMAHHQGMGFLALVNHFTGDLMLRRFTSDTAFPSVAHILQEQIPKAKPFRFQATESEYSQPLLESGEDLLRIFTTSKTPFPEVHLLSNGHYHVMVTNAGGGYSKCGDLMVTRWRSDATLDNFGTFFYVHDLTRAKKWSAAFHPARVDSSHYEAIFPQARAEFRRRDNGIETYTEIAVLPEDDIEHRRITIGNFSTESREIELTSYAEVVLLPIAQDASHPAFSNLFMETEILAAHNAILCSRRPRSPEDVNPWMLHLLAIEPGSVGEISFETDRLQFIGRGRTTVNPRAMEPGASLSNTSGAVLDPIVAIRSKWLLAPGESVTLSFITGIAETRAKALALIAHYQDRRHADRVFDLAQIHGSIILQQINATESEAQLYGRMASSILYPSPYRRSVPSILMKNRRGQSSLWAYAISGDLPIVLFRIGDIANSNLVVNMIQAHAYWRTKGLTVDLVIWNEDWSGYRQDLNNKISDLIAISTEAALYEKPGGIFVRHAEMISEEDSILMQSCASIVITDSGGSLLEQIRKHPRAEMHIPKLPFVNTAGHQTSSVHFAQDQLAFFNGWGGFSQDGREYVIHIKPDSPPPMPWVNVIANKQFGTVVSQSGGYSWAENAHEFRLTPWYNDPVSDASGEVYYIRNEATGKFWSATPLPCPAQSDYLQRQGFGYSVFECHEEQLKTELWMYVDSEAPVKFWHLRARNDAPTAQHYSSTLFLELVLGEARAKTQMHTRTFVDSKTGALFAANPYNTEFPDRVMFLESSEEVKTVTGDRTEFLGRNGTSADPEAMHRVRLSGHVGAGLDPAAVMQVSFHLEPGQEKDIVFILGCGKNIAEARELVYRFRGITPAYQARDRVWEFWNHTLGAINVESPDASFNMLVNGWLLYQTLSSRFLGRSGFYQSGGAFGFRDQLQDAMALVHCKPTLIREHLLLCASHQFCEGDVQHWWHPPHGRGVRTRIADDYLWLPLATCWYVEKIGDTGILDQCVHFLEGRMVNAGEESYYDLPLRSAQSVTLYEHCKVAVLNGLRFGEHGLPLMGCGDWNDGMNHVGTEGKGESVWLAFFLAHVLGRFAELARKQDDEEFALKCEGERGRLVQNIEDHAWDGEWYKRAFFDDGQALGSAVNTECRIDSIAQSWAVLSGASTPEHRAQAMHSLEQHLVRREHGIIALLDPPFDKSTLEPGYIKGYVPGIRENGGQYTHAAIWTVMAFAMQGDPLKANELLRLINPILHGASPEAILRYRVEPYVMAADIYGVEPHIGRGGWTWYTGSAAWMYRLMVESILGLDLRVDKLYFKPCLPAEWKTFKVHYKFHETLYHLHFTSTQAAAAFRIRLDGTELTEPYISLVDDHTVHHVELEQ